MTLADRLTRHSGVLPRADVQTHPKAGLFIFRPQRLDVGSKTPRLATVHHPQQVAGKNQLLDRLSRVVERYMPV